jgi:hypothetical protein
VKRYSLISCFSTVPVSRGPMPSAGVAGSVVLTIGLYIAHFDTQKVNIDHQMQSEFTGPHFAAPP